jgi:hypothetical protein
VSGQFLKMENMTPRVKQLVKDYLIVVNLKTVRKDLRIPLIKESIRKLNMLESLGLLDKMRAIYPMVGTTEPIIIKKN